MPSQKILQTFKASSTLRRRNLKTPGLFLRLGLSSTPIRLENLAFRKCSLNRRNLKTPAFNFSVDWNLWRGVDEA